jgi:hypothetical protein
MTYSDLELCVKPEMEDGVFLKDPKAVSNCFA